MGVLGAVYGARARAGAGASAIEEEKQEKWGDSTAHLSPGLAGRARASGGRGMKESGRGRKEIGMEGRVGRG